MLKCPTCGCDADKIIYAGLPGGMCVSDECATMWGLASWAAFLFFNGMVMVYVGSYWRALWSWLTEDDDGAD